MRTFAGINPKYASKERAKILLQPIPYDGTSTWGKGADKGFEAMLDAAENMELYDIETDCEVYKYGIHILPAIKTKSYPKAVFRAIYNKTKKLLETGKFLTFFGGEHSISIGIIKAFYEKYPELSVLHLDAHADLRPIYLKSPYNHACALHDASKHANLVQVGIRSMDVSEKKYMNRDRTFFACDIQKNPDWIRQVLEKLHSPVYITIDLDVFDPSIMPATGTPEPGGLNWYQVTNLLANVFSEFEVVGFDIVELAPVAILHHPQFTAAKLYYKLLSYKFCKKFNR